MEPIRAWSDDTCGRVWSAMAKRKGCRLAAWMNSRWSVRRPDFRRYQASSPSRRMAWRSSYADVSEGSGAPNDTVSGYGMCAGHFVRNRPRSKLKMLPHTRSRWTGITGTGRPLTIRSNPRRKGRSVPVLEIWPSGKNADDLALVERLSRAAQRAKNIAWAAAR